MKFISWNIARRTKTLGLALDVLEPDIIFLQESKNPTDAAPRGYYTVGSEIQERGRTENWGNQILSKTPLERVDLDTEYKGSMVAAVTTLDSGFRLGLLNLYGLLEPVPGNSKVKIVHFGLHRMLSDAGFWLSRFSEPKVDAFIVAGDLNKDRQMDGGRSLKSGRQISSNLLNRFTDFGLEEVLPIHYPAGVQTFRHSTSEVPWQIDHVFVSDKFAPRIESVNVLEDDLMKSASDHCPIVMEFNLPAG